MLSLAALFAGVVVAFAVAVAAGVFGAGSLDARADSDAHQLVLHNHAVLTAARTGTYLGAPTVVDVAAAVVAVVLWLRRRHTEALFVIAVRVLTQLIDSWLKVVVGRPRPSFVQPVAHASGFSFPSGHAAGAASLYVPLALVVLPALTSALLRHLTVTLAVVLCLLVATTRVLLGVHNPSDVLGGLALGGAVSCAMWPVAVARTGRRVLSSDGQ